MLMGTAASGGYYAALGADRIVASPTTVTGSVGVIMKFVNLESLFSKSVELAASLAAAALRRQMSPEEHQRLVSDALRDLQARERTVN